MDLDNKIPIDVLNQENKIWSDKLQGNILNGHGRDFTVNLFIRLPDNVEDAWAIVGKLAVGITSARKQEEERRRFKRFNIPGDMFRGLLLSASGYRRLGYGNETLAEAFNDDSGPPVGTSFLGGAKAAAEELADPPSEDWEAGFQGDLDALLILGEDDEDALRRELRKIVAQLPFDAIAQIEYGRALRNEEGEGIEHFGYVDGRSQPLFTFEDYALTSKGELNHFCDGHLREANGGRTDVFDPFAPLRIVLVRDRLQGDEDAFGSYFVFRKLEQDVRGFKLAEQILADKLKLDGADRERAGAMAVGRFEDGTPVVLSQTDGFLPAKENNFTYAQDPDGLKCPLQAHIRKTNPRGETTAPDEGDRRITRRAITYGTRPGHPQAAQDISELPSKDVGLLFMCFQSSIPRQFGFMQKLWANNAGFLKTGTGLDPLIGQGEPTLAAQHWRGRWGDHDPGLCEPQDVPFDMRGFVHMKGGEFFFAPSIPFLQNPPKPAAVSV